MPVDRNQPVYPPSKGEDILATWGDAVSEHVVQRFATPTDRDMRWSNPPKGALCVTVDTLTLWKHDGTNWVPVHERVGCVWRVGNKPIYGAGAAHPVRWQQSVADPLGMGTVNSNGFTVPANRSGLWAVTCILVFTTGDLGGGYLRLRVPSGIGAEDYQFPPIAGKTVGTIVAPMDAGMMLTVDIYTNVATTCDRGVFMMHRIGS